MNDSKTAQLSKKTRPSNKDQAPVEINARDLLGERRDVTIIHAGERYCLQITANDKLILTK